MFESNLIVAATEWRPGNAPVEASTAGRPATDYVRWVEFRADPSRASDAFELLKPDCAWLELEMLEDLLTPDQEPQGKRYEDHIRLTSSCRIAAHSSGDAKSANHDHVGGYLVIQPIELLAGPGWLISCWHGAQKFVDGQFLDCGTDINEFKEDMRCGMARRWRAGCGANSADLGTLLLHELVLGYGEAEHTLDTWLEHWELAHHQSVIEYSELSVRERREDLGRRSAVLRRQHAELTELSGAMAVLRAWITPQNRVGLKEDPERAWLAPADTELVCEVDDRIDSALASLHQLSQSLRSSFNLLQFQELEAQRDGREQLMRRIEIFAAAFLIPTLVVGFYGANTWIPGQSEHWGFWVMVVVLLLLSVAGVACVVVYQRLQARSLDRALRDDDGQVTRAES